MLPRSATQPFFENKDILDKMEVSPIPCRTSTTPLKVEISGPHLPPTNPDRIAQVTVFKFEFAGVPRHRRNPYARLD